MIVTWMFRKNAIAGRNREPPLDYKAAMEVGSAILQKNGYSHLANLCGGDPYMTRGSKDDEIRRLKEKVKAGFVFFGK